MSEDIHFRSKNAFSDDYSVYATYTLHVVNFDENRHNRAVYRVVRRNSELSLIESNETVLGEFDSKAEAVLMLRDLQTEEIRNLCFEQSDEAIQSRAEGVLDKRSLSYTVRMTVLADREAARIAEATLAPKPRPISTAKGGRL